MIPESWAEAAKPKERQKVAAKKNFFNILVMVKRGLNEAAILKKQTVFITVSAPKEETRNAKVMRMNRIKNTGTF
ncbi:hypothetical protein GCM10027189_00590 [Rufibacter soli]